MHQQNNAQNELTYLKEDWLQLESGWQNILQNNCFAQLISIDSILSDLSQNHIIYPPNPLIFNALHHTPLTTVKVVILGQDPYHGEGEANGLAFAVNSGVRLPPSLRNIYKELELEYGVITKNLTGEHLITWADQGVLLLNASLTVIKDQANSLAHIGWHRVTDTLIHEVSNHLSNVVFILWGNFAKQKAVLIDQNKHLILAGVHPSPLSAHRGFFGCNHFKLANQYLIEHGNQAIDWLGSRTTPAPGCLF